MPDEKEDFRRKLVPAVGSGIAVGAAMYVLGEVANPIYPAISGAVLGVLGFAAGFVIGLK